MTVDETPHCWPCTCPYCWSLDAAMRTADEPDTWEEE